MVGTTRLAGGTNQRLPPRDTSHRAQYARAVRGLSQATPKLFAPFTIKEWVSSPYGYYADCIRWPAPSRWVHPVPHHPSYPDVPTLVFVGDLDSLTSPSLFGGGCVLAVRSAQNAGKEVAAELARYAKNPAPDVVLVLTHADDAVDPRPVQAARVVDRAPVL